MKWTDINEIVFALVDHHEDCDPLTIRFTDLHQKVMQLPKFNDDPKHCNERILEAIQQAWIEEVA